MHKSDLTRRVSRDSSCKARSLSLYDKYFKSNLLVNFRWIFSIFRISQILYGDQTFEQYSSTGLTKATKALNNRFLSLLWKHLRISSAVTRADLHILSTCWEKDRWEEKPHQGQISSQLLLTCYPEFYIDIPLENYYRKMALTNPELGPAAS